MDLSRWNFVGLLLPLLLAATIIYVLASPRFRSGRGRIHAMALVGAGFGSLAAGLPRFADAFGHPEWLAYQSLLTWGAVLLLAPGIYLPVLEEAGPGDRRLFRFMARTAVFPALLFVVVLLLDALGVRLEWQTVALVALVTVVTVWGITVLICILTGRFRREDGDRPAEPGGAAPHRSP